MWVFSGPSVQCQEMCLSVSRRFPGHPMTETEDDRELFNPACRGHPMTETEDDRELFNPACRGHPMTETEDDRELFNPACRSGTLDEHAHHIIVFPYLCVVYVFV